MNQHAAEPAYLFRHALLREAAYELQPPTQRAALHAISLDLLAALARARPDLAGPMALELADHARAAGGTGAFSPDQAAEHARAEAHWLEIAADYANTRADYRGTAATLRRLQDNPALDDTRRVAARLFLARIELGLGNAPAAESIAQAALQLARALGQDGAAGSALNLVARALDAQGRPEHALQSHVSAVAALRVAGTGPLRWPWPGLRRA